MPFIDDLKHVDGVPWHDAPRPRRLHRCKVQTSGFYGYLTLVERCACGAIRIGGGKWRDRNSRR